MSVGGGPLSSRGKDRRKPRSATRTRGATRTRAEDALGTSEERYGSVVAALAEGIVFMHADGRLQASNASAERILGLTAEQIAGRTTFDPRWRAIHEDGSPFPGDTHPIAMTLRTGQPYANVIMGVHKPSGELTFGAARADLTRPWRPSSTSPSANEPTTFCGRPRRAFGTCSRPVRLWSTPRSWRRRASLPAG